MRPLALATGLAAILVMAGFALTIAASSPKTPPAMPAMEVAGQTMRGWAANLPPYQSFSARDGTAMSYRFYQGTPGGGVAVLVHGSTGLSASMDGVARTLNGSGFSVYALDLRGHGESGTLGDIGFRGQLETDMADLLAIVEKAYPAENRLLFGHSLGGAFALRIAAGPLGERFQGYLVTSPFLSADTTVSRPNSGGWADAAVPRIVALSLLNSIGISAFDGLAAIAYAVPADAPGKRARIYSHRLLANMSLPRDWRSALGMVRRPAAILIGADDEMFLASAYSAAVKAANPAIEVTVLPATDHMGSTVQPAALTRLAETAVRLREASTRR